MKAGDIIQMSYARGEMTYGVVASVDGRGAVTLHLPVGGADAARLDGRETALPTSFELDDAPGFERLFFVAADRPFKTALVMDACRKLADDPARVEKDPLVLPDGLEQSTFILRKAAP